MPLLVCNYSLHIEDQDGPVPMFHQIAEVRAYLEMKYPGVPVLVLRHYNGWHDAKIIAVYSDGTMVTYGIGSVGVRNS